MRALSGHLVLAVLALQILGGCNMISSDRTWVPQAPANASTTATPGAPPGPASGSWRAEPATAPASRPDQASASAPAGLRSPDSRGASTFSASGYTQATRYGDLFFISGQIAVDRATGNFAEKRSIEDETRITMENIRAILESNRLTLANLVSVTVYVKSINDLPAMDKVYETFFKGNLPARSVVEAAKLPRGALIEISAIAGR